MTETRFVCGCGKTYSSYPAFSTHKKQKHNNNLPDNSSIPKTYQPKRGRPAFNMPHQATSAPACSGLTIVELGLLSLEDKYRHIMSDPEDEPDLNMLQQQYQKCLLSLQQQRQRQNQQQRRFTSAIYNFNEIIITHVRSDIAIVVTVFLQSMTSFFITEGLSNNLLEGSAFNLFFSNKENTLKPFQMAKKCNLDMAFYLNLTVILSNYLVKVGAASSAIRLKGQDTKIY